VTDLGRWLVVAGVLLIALGLLAQSGALTWIGRLPGDIRIERPGISFYFPLTSMLVISVVVSAAVYLLRRFF
jgi:membrane protein implicated in regulation of membrane protease activity